MKSDPINRRRFLAAAGSALATAPLAAAEGAPEARVTSGLVDCQSHLFFPEVLDLMRRRKTEPLVYLQDGTTFLKMGDWLRKVPPLYLDVDAKLASMDANGIAVAMTLASESWMTCATAGPSSPNHSGPGSFVLNSVTAIPLASIEASLASTSR